MQAVNRVSTILRAISSVEDGLALSAVSDSVRLPKSTTYRILQALQRENFVYYDEYAKKYRLGSEILVLGSKVLSQMDTIEVSRPYLEELFFELDETVFLTVLEKDRAVCVLRMEPQGRRVRYFVDVGAILPFHCSAAGKAILAFQPPETMEMVLGSCSYDKYTDHTLANRILLEKDIATIRSKGYAMCDREMEPLVRAVAAPVLDQRGIAIASVTCTGLIDKFSEEFLNIATQAVLKCAAGVASHYCALTPAWSSTPTGDRAGRR
jgi:DNA-binding IclR family transcriptional regulator